MLRDVAILAQSAERIHGKDEVNSSILLDGSKITPSGVFVCQLRKQTALLSCRIERRSAVSLRTGESGSRTLCRL